MGNLQKIVEAFERMKVLLIGDTIVDVYTYGTALGLSAETPTIVARKRETNVSLGGAALVCRNLLELGATVWFMTLVGEDEDAEHLRSFKDPKLHLIPIIDKQRVSTVKHRFWVDGYKLFQLDTRDESPISSTIADEVMTHIESCLADIDVIVISDYRHGLLSGELIEALLARLRQAGKPLFVDSQVSQNQSNHKLYRGGGVICVNLKEAQCVDPGFVPKADAAAFSNLADKLRTDKIVVKLGADGALMLAGTEVVRASANKVNVCDTTGAGDAFLSAFCLSGLGDPHASLKLANAWAGLAVARHGPSPPSKRDLLTMINGMRN